MANFRRKKTQKLQDVLQELAKVQHLDKKLNELRIQDVWPKVVGNMINEYTSYIHISHHTLFIKIDSSVLRNELWMHRTQLMEKINTEIGDNIISQIVFR